MRTSRLVRSSVLRPISPVLPLGPFRYLYAPFISNRTMTTTPSLETQFVKQVQEIKNAEPKRILSQYSYKEVYARLTDLFDELELPLDKITDILRDPEHAYQVYEFLAFLFSYGFDLPAEQLSYIQLSPEKIKIIDIFYQKLITLEGGNAYINDATIKSLIKAMTNIDFAEIITTILNHEFSKKISITTLTSIVTNIEQAKCTLLLIKFLTNHTKKSDLTDALISDFMNCVIPPSFSKEDLASILNQFSYCYPIAILQKIIKQNLLRDLASCGLYIPNAFYDLKMHFSENYRKIIFSYAEKNIDKTIESETEVGLRIKKKALKTLMLQHKFLYHELLIVLANYRLTISTYDILISATHYSLSVEQLNNIFNFSGKHSAERIEAIAKTLSNLDDAHRLTAEITDNVIHAVKTFAHAYHIQVILTSPDADSITHEALLNIITNADQAKKTVSPAGMGLFGTFRNAGIPHLVRQPLPRHPAHDFSA